MAKKVVLVGGCFDILHLGHIVFLEKARAKGDRLVVLLESDESIRGTKGNGRPIQPQEERARILSSLRMVDQVIPLPKVLTDQEYDNLIQTLHPDVIATTKGDPNIEHKRRQAQLIGADLIEVTPMIPHKSTTKAWEVILEEI